ncbi:hypothetical protein EON83_26445 [bacterium]|nr:MAG: hypothetical protein EON83_26445 [bacterium]
MESEVLSEDIEWEARRHAAAFGLSGWDIIGCDSDEDAKALSFRAQAEGLWFECWYGLDEFCKDAWHWEINDYGYGGGIYTEDDIVATFGTHNGELECEVDLLPSSKKKADAMVSRLLKAAYMMGYPIEVFNIELGLTLSYHEQLELRLSMPREFWPQKWLDEEAA